MQMNEFRQAQDRMAKTIKALKETRNEHEAYLKLIETRTRQLLIDPMLEALDWDVRNPAQVHLEYKGTSGNPDYALFSHGNVVALIEAKKLETPLARIQVEQVIRYARDQALTSLKYVVWTNGDHWRIWSIENNLEESFRLSNMQEYECAAKVIQLLRRTLEVQEVSPTPEPSSEKEVAESSNNGDWGPLTSSLIKKTRKPPANTNIKLPDSSTKPINHWIDILVSVANYLIETGKISAQDCPVSLENSRRHLLHTEPIHSTGNKFHNKRKIGELWLNIDLDGKDALKYSCRLLKEFHIDPSTVLVSTTRAS